MCFTSAYKLYNENKYTDALKIIDNYPDDSEAQILKMRILNSFAISLAKNGKIDDAIRVIKPVFKLDLESYTESHDSYGEILLLAGKYDEAIVQLNMALKNPSAPVEAYFNMAVCYEKKYQFHNVLPYLHTVLERINDDSHYRKNQKPIDFQKYKHDFIKEVKEMKSAMDWLFI